MRPTASIRAFTLVELIVALTLAAVLMAAMLSSYLFLGRSLTRLSYQHMLEQQSRTILTTVIADLRNTKSVTNATNTGLTLQVFTGSGTTTSVAYAYTYDSVNNVYILTRNGIPLVKMITGTSVKVPVTMLLPPTGAPSAGNLFQYYNSTDVSLTAPVNSPMSIKQVEFSFILQAGAAGVQDKQGTLTQYQMASGRIPLLNRQLPDGS